MIQRQSPISQLIWDGLLNFATFFHFSVRSTTKRITGAIDKTFLTNYCEYFYVGCQVLFLHVVSLCESFDNYINPIIFHGVISFGVDVHVRAVLT